ncbi:MAG TPA: hypothetical protein VMB47_01785 [Candidatus Aquilonibacter sp.]|nr:hypothetical protein [Candidatus Aquilonibacter sp.]
MKVKVKINASIQAIAVAFLCSASFLLVQNHSASARARLSASRPMAQDQSRAIANGGISVPGWQGEVDAAEAGRGMSVSDAKLTEENGVLHVTTGPAITYWDPKNVASGDYTVKATFTEPKFMNLNTHPHPYGIVIAGDDMGTPQATYLYCAAYGNGTFIVRGMGPQPFQMNGRGAAAPSVHKAEAPGSPVTQDIAMSVSGDKVSCSINGAEVASYPKSDVVGPGKLKSTDGVYGIRFAHNTEGTVTGLTMTKQ